MKLSHLFLLPAFTVFLSACQSDAPVEEESTVSVLEDASQVIEPLVDCSELIEVKEGWWCYEPGDFFVISLPLEIQSYISAASGSFYDPETKRFIQATYFPLTAFSTDAKAFLGEGKIKEYVEYEQANVCKPDEGCTSMLDAGASEYLELGSHRFLRYEVINDAESDISSTHYATVLNDALLNFSTFEGLEIDEPDDNSVTFTSIPVERELFEEILSTLVVR